MSQGAVIKPVNVGSFHFAKTADIRRVLEAQQWPVAPDSLDDQDSIDQLSREWVREKRVTKYLADRDLPESERVHLPTAQALFDLAADTIVGPHPTMLGPRLQAVREMGRLPARSLFGLFAQKVTIRRSIKPDRGNQERLDRKARASHERSTKAQMAQFEAGSREPSAELIAAMAPIYCVDQQWLHRGVVRYPGTDRDLMPYERPSWLHGYIKAVDAALHVLDEVNGPLDDAHQVLMNLFTSEADWLFDRPTRARWLPFFPFCHGAIMAARDRHLSVLPRSLRPRLINSLTPLEQRWDLLTSGELRKRRDYRYRPLL